MLGDLAPSHGGPWQLHGGPSVSAAHIVDPDSCDPVPHPQFDDPTYPRNPAWVNERTVSWSDTDTSNMVEVNETVLTYSSAASASADFAKHRGWVADCAAHYQWTDKPAKYSVSAAQLTNVADSYAIRATIDLPDQTAATAGSQGIAYTAVILRGNSLSFVSMSESGSVSSKPQDPGLTNFQHDAQTAAAKLGAVYAPSH